MRLTFQTDYALRMLIYLTTNSGPATVADVAASYGISRNHLLKVARRLGKYGYIRTLRGRTGGIELAQRPEDINLGAVVRRMEDDFALVECMRPDGGGCVISPVCRLKGLVGKALDAFLAVFDEYTLAEITANRAALHTLLAADRA